MGKLGKPFVFLFLISTFILFQNFKFSSYDHFPQSEILGGSRVIYPEGSPDTHLQPSHSFSQKTEDSDINTDSHSNIPSVKGFTCDPQDKKVFYIDLKKLKNIEDPTLSLQISLGETPVLEELINLDNPVLSAGPCLDVNQSLIGSGVLKVCLPQASDAFYFKIIIESQEQRKLIFEGIETVDLKCERDQSIYPLQLNIVEYDLNSNSKLNDWNN